MSEEENLNSIGKVPSASIGRKVLVGFGAFFAAVVLIAALSGKSSTTSETASKSLSQDASVSTSNPSVAPKVVSTKPWYPAGFSVWASDENIAVRWAPAGFTCNQYENGCYKAIFISHNGCPREFYAAINLLDSSGSVINYSNGSLPTLLPLQRATIDFQDINGDSKSAQMSQITCL